MAKGRILIVDDDVHILKALDLFLKHEGMEATCCTNGEQGLAYIRNETYDLVLLDLDLPDTDGLNVLESIRAARNTIPIMIISGHDEEYNKLLGLGMGADDYITKPFSMPLLLSKIKALIRRAGTYAETADASLCGGPFQLNRSTYRVTKNGHAIDLTARELALFTFFLEHPNQVFSKSQIYEAVWDSAIVDENSVMVYMKRLRDKLEDDPSNPQFLQTMRGIGYRFAIE